MPPILSQSRVLLPYFRNLNVLFCNSIVRFPDLYLATVSLGTPTRQIRRLVMLDFRAIPSGSLTTSGGTVDLILKSNIVFLLHLFFTQNRVILAATALQRLIEAEPAVI
jgi:hypothetical protein